MPFPFTSIETDICELRPLDEEQVCTIRTCIRQLQEEALEISSLDEEQICTIKR